MSADLEAIKKRIRDLTTRTTDRGCTEAEALAAAAKAADLMAKYRLSADDIEVEEKTIKSRTSGHSVRDVLYRHLARLTNTVTYIERGTRVFLGRPCYVQIAVYLATVLGRAIDRAVAAEKAGATYRRFRKLSRKRDYIRAFTSAMVNRLLTRLTDLLRPAVDKAALDQAVAVVDSRNDLVTLKTRKEKPASADNRAILSGLRAGEAVPLHHAARGQADPVRLIG